MADDKKRSDPAFLFYPGDASDDTQFMNRLERGCYFDLLKAQKKHRKFTLAFVKKVLGRDFDQCWPAIELVLKKDGEFYFIEWVDNSINDRAAHAAKQKKRIQDWWDRKRKAESVPDPNQTNTTVQPEHTSGNTLEDENASEDENEIKDKGVQGEKGVIKKHLLFKLLFDDELFTEQLAIAHKGKSINQAFEECYTHWANAPNPPAELWEWKQKLNTWLSIAKIPSNGTRNGTKTSIRPAVTNDGKPKTFGTWE
jgi:hypothetical protein